MSPKHKYEKAGSYKVSLKVTDDFGDSVMLNETITVQERIGRQASPGKDLMGYLDEYANMLGLVVAGLGSIGGYFVVRRKRGVLGRQMALVEEIIKIQNPYEAYQKLCNVRDATSKLLKAGKISENNYLILDNKIRDHITHLKESHPDLLKTASFQKSPYEQRKKDDVDRDSPVQYKK